MDLYLKKYIEQVAQEMVGRIIYKYVDLSGGMAAIKEMNLMFRCPNRFNDPFDCSVELLSINPEAARQHFHLRIENDYERNYPEKEVLKRKLDNSLNQIAPFFKSSLKEDLSNRGVTCFSRICDHILMWAHYTGNHNGLSIGYDAERLYSSLRRQIKEIAFLPIKYKDQIEPASMYPRNSKAVLYWLGTKAAEWQYESEIRITGSGFQFDDKGRAFIAIETNSIKEINIGMKVSEDDTARLKRLIQRRCSHVELYKMEPDFQRFRLTRRRLDK